MLIDSLAPEAEGMVMPEDWYTLDEAAKYLKVSKPTLYRLCAAGHLPYYNLAGVGARRFKLADLDALLVPGRPEAGSREGACDGA